MTSCGQGAHRGERAHSTSAVGGRSATMARLRQMNDTQLAHMAASSGCEGAFATLFNRYSPALRQFISRKLGVRYHLTDDISMEAWADAYRGLADFRGDSSFRTWIYSIALNRVRVKLRALNARKRRVPDGYDPPRSVQDTAEQIHLRMELDRVLSELPPKAARVLVDKELIGFSHEEIAERMGVSVGTTKSQLHRGKELARSALKDGAKK